MYAELTRKTCSKCKRAKLVSEFQKDSRALSKLSSKCKVCIKLKRAEKPKDYYGRYWKKWSKENAEKLRLRDIGYNLKRKFNMTVEQYEELKASQNGKCATCPKPHSSNGKSLAVDHCHLTGKIRGLLCNECNTSLGLVKENIQTLKNLINYLEINGKK